MLNQIESLVSDFNPLTGKMSVKNKVERRLSDLRNCFLDEDAFEASLGKGDPVVYRVQSFEPAKGDGDLHYGIGILFPGKVGDEYWLTKGHYHEWREAAELYIGLSGEGFMLLEHEKTHETELLPLKANSTVYVPGYTAHRTINTGDEPLTYLGVYPARAGHDYGSLKEKGFSNRVLFSEDGPVLKSNP